MKKREGDILILFLFLALAACFVLYFSVELVVSVLLFFGLPALWLSIQMPQRIAKSALFTLLFTLPFLFIIDHIATLDGAWHVPTQFSFRLFGTIPLEDLFIGLGVSYLLSLFYEYFFTTQGKVLGKKMKYFTGGVCFALCLFFSLLFFAPAFLQISYAYIFLGIIFLVIPIVIFSLYSPKIFLSFLSAIPYFFIFFLAFEIVGLKLGHWSFPGTHFLGWVQFGTLQFPFEELLFWIILSPIAFFSYYEFFNNDRPLLTRRNKHKKDR